MTQTDNVSVAYRHLGIETFVVGDIDGITSNLDECVDRSVAVNDDFTDPGNYDNLSLVKTNISLCNMYIEPADVVDNAVDPQSGYLSHKEGAVEPRRPTTPSRLVGDDCLASKTGTDVSTEFYLDQTEAAAEPCILTAATLRSIKDDYLTEVDETTRREKGSAVREQISADSLASAFSVDSLEAVRGSASRSAINAASGMVTTGVALGGHFEGWEMGDNVGSRAPLNSDEKAAGARSFTATCRYEKQVCVALPVGGECLSSGDAPSHSHPEQHPPVAACELMSTEAPTVRQSWQWTCNVDPYEATVPLRPSQVKSVAKPDLFTALADEWGETTEVAVIDGFAAVSSTSSVRGSFGEEPASPRDSLLSVVSADDALSSVSAGEDDWATYVIDAEESDSFAQNMHILMARNPEEKSLAEDLREMISEVRRSRPETIDEEEDERKPEEASVIGSSSEDYQGPDACRSNVIVGVKEAQRELVGIKIDLAEMHREIVRMELKMYGQGRSRMDPLDDVRDDSAPINVETAEGSCGEHCEFADFKPECTQSCPTSLWKTDEANETPVPVHLQIGDVRATLMCDGPTEIKRVETVEPLGSLFCELHEPNTPVLLHRVSCKGSVSKLQRVRSEGHLDRIESKSSRNGADQDSFCLPRSLPQNAESNLRDGPSCEQNRCSESLYVYRKPAEVDLFSTSFFPGMTTPSEPSFESIVRACLLEDSESELVDETRVGRRTIPQQRAECDEGRSPSRHSNEVDAIHGALRKSDCCSAEEAKIQMGFRQLETAEAGARLEGWEPFPSEKAVQCMPDVAPVVCTNATAPLGECDIDHSSQGPVSSLDGAQALVDSASRHASFSNVSISSESYLELPHRSYEAQTRFQTTGGQRLPSVSKQNVASLLKLPLAEHIEMYLQRQQEADRNPPADCLAQHSGTTSCDDDQTDDGEVIESCSTLQASHNRGVISEAIPSEKESGFLRKKIPSATDGATYERISESLTQEQSSQLFPVQSAELSTERIAGFSPPQQVELSPTELSPKQSTAPVLSAPGLLLKAAADQMPTVSTIGLLELRGLLACQQSPVCAAPVDTSQFRPLQADRMMAGSLQLCAGSPSMPFLVESSADKLQSATLDTDYGSVSSVSSFSDGAMRSRSNTDVSSLSESADEAAAPPPCTPPPPLFDGYGSPAMAVGLNRQRSLFYYREDRPTLSATRGRVGRRTASDDQLYPSFLSPLSRCDSRAGVRPTTRHSRTTRSLSEAKRKATAKPNSHSKK